MAYYAAAGPIAAVGLAALAIATAICAALGARAAVTATVCGSSSLDVAMLSLVMLGRRAPADWRVGHSHRSGRPVVRSPGDLDVLARATHGFRVSRVDKAKTRVFRSRSATSPSGTKAVGYVGAVIEAVASLAGAIATDRQRPERITTLWPLRCRCQQSRSTHDVPWPEWWLSGTSRYHRRSTRSVPPV